MVTHGLLSTLVGGIHMDAWLKNWIDEWEEGYDKLEAAKIENPRHGFVLGSRV